MRDFLVVLAFCYFFFALAIVGLLALAGLSVENFF